MARSSSFNQDLNLVSGNVEVLTFRNKQTLPFYTARTHALDASFVTYENVTFFGIIDHVCNNNEGNTRRRRMMFGVPFWHDLQEGSVLQS